MRHFSIFKKGKQKMKNVLRLFLILCLGLASTAVFAQDIQTRGSIGGTVTDANGGAIPGAAVTVTGALGERTTTTESTGVFDVENLVPGRYSVKVTNAGFKTALAPNVEVFVGKQSTLTLKLEPGEVSATVEVTDTGSMDRESTATSSNLNDQLFNNIAVQRNVTSLFYLAPGVTDSLGGGANNPSISGGSALDNLYVADGVNITDSAFGGIGTFSRVYGGLGTGINTAFVKEVQVKTAGFEAQYGQSQGGIINIITQSGGNEYHGSVYGFARPDAFEATRKQPDDIKVNKVGKILAQESYDAGVDAGGPFIKDKLFFFGSFNPSVRRDLVLGAEGSGVLTILGKHARRSRSYNYAYKTDWNINPNHQFAFSIYGDPTKTNKTSWNSLNIDNTTAQSVLDYGSRNMALRYNGALTPTWTMSASWGWNHNHFDETGFDDFNQIADRTQTGGTLCVTPCTATRGTFTAIGLGFVEPTRGNTYRLDWATSKTIASKWLLGSHALTVGYQYQRAYYAGSRDRSGPHYTVPATNATGLSLSSPLIGAGPAIGQTLNAAWSLRVDVDGSSVPRNTCTLCPLMAIPGNTTNLGYGPGLLRVFLRQDRGEYGPPTFNTRSNYNAFYGQDVWRVNKYITANLGLRNEQERIIGSEQVLKYSFTGQWAPRIGVSVDPLGKGKTKVFYNFGRFFESVPLDEGERSLSSELDFIGARFAPQSTLSSSGLTNGQLVAVINSHGTVNPVVDSAHLLNRATGGSGTGIAIGTQNTFNPILPGTKLGYADEHTIGFEQQLPGNLVFSVRYIDRKLKRITEDAAVISPEDYQNGLFGQVYFIGNISATLDAAVNPIPHIFPNGGAIPAACDPDLVASDIFDSNGNTLPNAVCYETNGKNGKPAGSSGADGVADGFPDPVHTYKALEIEVNKRFSNNWQLLSNWRIAKLNGNFEGHFRNDNGQTDPGISSLFDFTAGSFGLLGDQFKPGPLNTDRRHIVNIYGNYEFGESKYGKRLGGLNLGPGIHFETGVPISKFFAHPAYLNAGEIPVGGRGSLGRTDPYFRFDFHANYPWKVTERLKLNFVGDFFNVFNSTKVRLPDQNFQLTVGSPNVDFLKPSSGAVGSRGYYLPFNMRFGIRLEW
jgi:hypothetical protein